MEVRPCCQTISRCVPGARCIEHMRRGDSGQNRVRAFTRRHRHGLTVHRGTARLANVAVWIVASGGDEEEHTEAEALERIDLHSLAGQLASASGLLGRPKPDWRGPRPLADIRKTFVGRIEIRA